MNPTLKARLFNALELLLLLSIVLAILLPFSPVSPQSVPSRDSGVFLYTGWRVLQGEIPYLQIWDHKPPVIYYLNALGLLLSPDSIWGVWIVEVASLGLAAAFGYSLFKRLYGIFPAALLSFLWLFSAFFLLVGGNLTTEYGLPFQFALLWLFYRAESERRYGWRGFALGAVAALLFFTRQTAIGIALAIGLYLLLNRLSRREIGRFFRDALPILAGGLAVTAVILGYFALQGALPAFWEVAFQYNFAYAEERGIADQINAIFQGLKHLNNLGLALLAFIGWSAALGLLIYKKERFAPTFRSLLWLAIIALPVELWLVSVGGRPRIPYFTVLLPIFAVLAGFALWLVLDSVLKDIPPLAGAALTVSLVISLCAVFSMDYRDLVDFYTQPSGDPALIAYIQNNTTPEETVLMWGAESAYNFMARRASPTRFVYQYPLYKGFGGKSYVTEFLNAILTKRPRLIIMQMDDKLYDFRFGYRDDQVGALMDQIKPRYSPTIQIGDWQVYTDNGQSTP